MTPGPHCLLCYTEKSVKFQVKIKNQIIALIYLFLLLQDNKYNIGSGEQFDDLVGLIEHLRLYPMIENSGDVLRLLQPVSGTCLRAKDIQQRVQVI